MENPKSSEHRRDQAAGDGAVYTRSAGRSVPASFGDPAAELTALKTGAAIVELPKTVLRLSGRDPIGMLNAVLTNEVPKEGGAYAALLNPKGRVQTDVRVLKSGESVLVLTEPEGAEAAKEILGLYAPFSRVKVEDLTASFPLLGLYGPRAQELLGGLQLGEHETAEVGVGGERLLAAGVAAPVAGYDLIGPAQNVRAAREYLAGRGATPAGLDAYETARIEAAIPRFGADITPENFPGESEEFLARAVSFGKGCYPGQETVARMHYRGHPNKTLQRFSIEGAPPEPGTPILQGDKQVGSITSVAPVPVEGERLALGYLHRSADPGGSLRAEGAALRPLAPK